MKPIKFFAIHVGKYTNPMDGMGKELQNLEKIHPEHNSGLQVLWGRFEYLGSSYNYKDSKILGFKPSVLVNEVLGNKRTNEPERQLKNW